MVDFHTATPVAYPDGFLIGTHGSLITTITITIIIIVTIIIITTTIVIIIVIIIIKKGCLSWARSQLVFVTGSLTDHSVATDV